MSHAVPSAYFGRAGLLAKSFAAEWNRVGRQVQFYASTLRSVGDAVANYRVELLRLVAQMALGTGALILVGGTVVIVGFLTLSAGALVAVQGYNVLASVGVDALVGFVSSYVNVRLSLRSVWPPPLALARPRSLAPCALTKRSTRWK